MVYLTLRSVHAVGKTRVDTISTGFPIFIYGQETDLKILLVPVLFDYSPYTFFTGLLGRFSLPHQFHDQKATDGTDHFLSNTGSGGRPHFIIDEEACPYNRGIPDPSRNCTADSNNA